VLFHIRVYILFCGWNYRRFYQVLVLGEVRRMQEKEINVISQAYFV